MIITNAVDVSASTNTLTPTNYIKFGNGLAVCWGSLDISLGSNTTETFVTFPIPFSSIDRFAVLMNPISQRAHTDYTEEDNPYKKSTTGFTIFWRTGISTDYYEWVAIGYVD